MIDPSFVKALDALGCTLDMDEQNLEDTKLWIRNGKYVLGVDYDGCLLDAVEIIKAYPTPHSLIYQGSYGLVLQCKDTVVKVVPLSRGILPCILKEIYIGTQIAPYHSYLYPLQHYEYVEKGAVPYMVLVMEKARGDLYDVLNEAHSLTLNQALNYMYEIATALQGMHQYGLIHMDIKPGNILIRNGTAYLADFGLSVWENAAFQQIPEGLITKGWRPPEMLTGNKKITQGADIWSLGITFLQIIASLSENEFTKGRMDSLVKEPTKLIHLQNTCKTGKEFYHAFMRTTTTLEMPPGFWDMVYSMLQPTAKRASIDQIQTQLSQLVGRKRGLMLRGKTLREKLCRREQNFLKTVDIRNQLMQEQKRQKVDISLIKSQWEDIISTWHSLNKYTSCDLLTSLYCVIMLYWSGPIFNTICLKDLSCFQKCIPVPQTVSWAK